MYEGNVFIFLSFGLSIYDVFSYVLGFERIGDIELIFIEVWGLGRV